MNILANAIESVKGNGTISISVEEMQNEANFEIKDTGTGNSPNLYAVVFEHFYSTKGALYGTGIGLGITYSFIEKYQGSISISANQSAGTIGTIELPLW